MNKPQSHKHRIPMLKLTGIIIAIGIVYGNIGTSSLYVMKAVLNALPYSRPDLIVGAVSCVIWTLVLQTTIKYVLITLRADNKGEGGILALFALIRRKISQGLCFCSSWCCHITCRWRYNSFYYSNFCD